MTGILLSWKYTETVRKLENNRRRRKMRRILSIVSEKRDRKLESERFTGEREEEEEEDVAAF